VGPPVEQAEGDSADDGRQPEQQEDLEEPEQQPAAAG